MESSIEPLSIKKNILWNSFGSLFYLCCQYLLSIIVVRLSAGFDDAGVLSLAMSVVGIFGTFANYKMGTYQISDIHHEHTLSEYYSFRLITLGLAGIACVVYSLATCPISSLITIVLYFIYKAVGLVIDVLHGIDQQMRRMDYIGKSFIAQGAVSISSFTITYVFFSNLNLSIICMTAGVLAVLFFYDRPHSSQFESFHFGISRNKVFFFLRISFSAVIASVAASAIVSVPKQYLANMEGEAALGIYSSVAAPALIIQMGAQYLYGPLLDIFPKLFFENKIKEFIQLLLKTSAGIVCVAFVCMVGLSLFGKFLLVLLFGAQIADYTSLLPGVMITTFLTAFLWLFGDLLLTLRNFRAYFIGNIISLAAVAPLSYYCINLWGMNGVSIASSAASIIGVAYLMLMLVICIRSSSVKE